jgi:hypothetical protein
MNCQSGTFVIRFNDIESTGKALPIQVRISPQGYRSWRLPDLKTIGKIVTPTRRPPLPRENIPGTHIALGHAVAQLVEALRYKLEGREFDSR